MELGLAGKVVLVPASSHGLGRAVALAFAREGARVAMCSRDGNAIDAAAAEVRDLGADVLAVQADLRNPGDITAFVDSAVERYGGIDVLVTNAGGPPAGSFDRFDDDDWRAAFDLTLMSAVRLIRAALPSMRQRGSGRIILPASSSVKQPISNLILSNVFRTGVTALAKTLADELALENIRVNTVVPGRIATRRLDELDRANAERAGVDISTVRAEVLKQIPMRRHGEPAEFADAVVFLASDRASYITGVTLQVDGGMIRSLW
jgi:3-oxoacyl-[acyl-carrier protein] reductase